MKFRLSLLSILLMALVFVLGACQKEEDKGPDINYAERDEGLITDYITANNLSADTVSNSTGTVHIVVTQPGTGDFPKAGSTIIVKYKGTLLDGTVFDQSRPEIVGFAFVLNAEQLYPNDLSKIRAIKGWDLAFKRLRKGSKAILLIPSELAYKGGGTATIPAHSVLRFDVEVINIK